MCGKNPIAADRCPCPEVPGIVERGLGGVGLVSLPWVDGIVAVRDISRHGVPDRNTGTSPGT